MQIEKSQTEGKRIMLKMRYSKFPALSIDLRVGVFRSALDRDYFFPYLLLEKLKF